MPLRPHMFARPVWVTLGALSLGLGIIGIVLPILPTTPLVLLAAFCFGKGALCGRGQVWCGLFWHIVHGQGSFRAVPLIYARVPSGQPQ